MLETLKKETSMADEARHILPDILAPTVDVVIVGAAVPDKSAGAGHYYARGGNSFWRRLHAARLTPRLMTHLKDRGLLNYGIGLTDLDKTSQSNTNVGLLYDVAGFLEKMSAIRPDWIVFNGKDPVDDGYRRLAGVRRRGFGRQAWTIEGSRVFVAPSTSGRVPDTMLITGPDGAKRPALDYWLELGDLVRETRKH